MPRKKKSTTTGKRFSKKNTLVVVIVLFLALPFMLFLIQDKQQVNQYAQQTGITPTFGAIAPCPSCDAPTTEPVVTSAPEVTTAPNQEEPCDASTAARWDRNQNGSNGNQNWGNRGNGRGNQDGNQGGGFFQQLMQLLQQLIDMIMQLFGGGNQPPGNNPPPGEQPQQPNEPGTPNNPCDNPQEPQPTDPVAQPSAEPSVAPSTAPTDTTAFVPASTQTCAANYNLNSPLKKNFGDPSCDFDKNKLYDQLKQIDAANADIWFNEVVPCESSFNPNAYASPATGTPDQGGAWGLFQMGSSSPQNSPPPAPGKNGQYDRGDINWGLQASNAVNYNNLVINGNWRYWACAKAHWK